VNKGNAAAALMSREVSSNYDNSAYTNTRNNATYQPLQRMEANAINNATNTVNTVTVNDYRSNSNVINRNEIGRYEYTSVNDRSSMVGYGRVGNGAFGGYIDAGLRPASNSHINPGGGTVSARYSPASRKYYYYCTSDYTKSKSRSVCKGNTSCNNTNILRPDDDLSFWWCYPGYFNALAIINNQVVQRDLLLASDYTTRHSNSSQYFSFDGYIVYESDTVPGIVTVTNNSVVLERHIKQTGRNYYNVELSDLMLKAIVVFKGPKELHLVRLMEQDKHLSRVVHNGKLRLYDRSYDFLTASNVGRHLHVIDPISGKKAKISSIKELAAQVNGTYNLTLNPETISRKELITIINRLD
jgi:hypothetical protein